MLQVAIHWLQQNGYRVESAGGVPGLYIVDGGPELTIGQVISFWMSKSGNQPRREMGESDAEFRARLFGSRP